MTGAGVGVVAIVPTVWPMVERASLDSGLPAVAVVLASLAQTLALTAIATAAGIVAGRTTGLGVPPLRPWFIGDPARRPWTTIATAGGVGVATAVVIVALDTTVFAQQAADLAGSGMSRPTWWAGLTSAL